jgi:hypothetical protein
VGVVSGTVLLGKPGIELERSFVEMVAAARNEDPQEPLTVLVGSNILGAHLRLALAERLGGLFNVRFLTFADVAESLARGAGKGLGYAPRYVDRIIAHELVSSSRGSQVFGEAGTSRGFGDALRATFSDLAESGCSPEIARAILGAGSSTARLGEMMREVLSLYVRFRERIEALGGDIQNAFQSALSAPPPPSLGTRIFAYGFYDFNEMQRRLLTHCARERAVSLFIPWGEGEAYRFVAATRKRLEESLFETVILPGTERDVPPSKPKLLNVPGEEQEIREIVRRILALADVGGVRFGEIAVVLPSIETYGALCREVFDEASVPYYMHAGALSGGGAAARSARVLLSILGGDMERRDLVEFLVSLPLRPAGARATTSDSFALWVRKSAEAGLAGERGWIRESAALVARLALAAEKGVEERAAFEAAAEVDSLIRTIVRALEAAQGESTWRDHATAFAALVREVFPESEDRETACGAIERLSALDRTGSKISFETFSLVAEAALSENGPSVGRFGGEGVNILTFAEARGLSFRAVFIPGLAERIFPTTIRQDPLLADPVRRELNAISGGAISLSAKSDRLDEEALLFELARRSAREEIVCSYPRFEEGTGKERIPSSFLRFVEGYSIDGAHDDALDHERVSQLAPAARGVELLSADELDFENARSYAAGSGALPDNVFFSRGARLVRGRWGTPRFTPYDGVFSSKTALAALRDMLAAQKWRFAPTSLETYAGCPFDYFITRVLGIEVLEEPERMVSIAPRERGILIHRILARLFGELKERGFLPLSAAPAEEVFGVADGIVTQLLDDFSKTEPVGLPVFWELDKRLVRESVRLLIEEERLERDGFVPSHFERSFGRDRDGIDVSFECGGRDVFFHGRIDRIDTAVDGRFRIIDYKTGKLVGKDQDLEHGTALQLPIYLIAAARILGAEIRDGEARYRHVGAGEGRRAVVFSGGLWDEGSARFEKTIDVITRGIERGIFFAPAGEQECRNCDVRIACPSGMPRLFAMKVANDERAREYVDMRGGQEEAG